MDTIGPLILLTPTITAITPQFMDGRSRDEAQGPAVRQVQTLKPCLEPHLKTNLGEYSIYIIPEGLD